MKQYLSLIKLAALFVFVPLLIYLSAVSRTVRLYREYRQARELSDRGLSSTGTAAAEIPDYAPVISNGDIVGLLSPICSRNGISIREYIPEEIERERDIWLCHAGIVLSGDVLPRDQNHGLFIQDRDERQNRQDRAYVREYHIA